MHQDDGREKDAKERGEILLSGSRSNVVAGKVSSGAEFYIFRANKAEQGRWKGDTFMCDVHINVRKADET